MRRLRRSPIVRRWRANWRDTVLLLREFRWPLVFFVLTLFGGGLLYFLLARNAGEPVANLPEAIYLVLGLTFLNPMGEFPNTWYLEAFYFLMPIIGVGIIAQGVTEFGMALFNRRTRSKEWEMSVATTYNRHIILVGLGHLGFRVTENLHRIHQDVVVIELAPSHDLADKIRQLGIPLIEDDGTREAALEAAGVRKARSIILCTQTDSLNLQMAVKARSLNPNIQVTVRIFDDDFAQALHEQFGFVALSATGMSAPAFASAAAGVDITRPITVEGQALSLARLCIQTNAPLVGVTVGAIEKRFEISVVMLRRRGEPDLHPLGERILQAGDVIAVLGEPAQINLLVPECTDD